MPQTIGVIGGGQLARMMIPPAINTGLGIHVLAEEPGMSASLAATRVGDYRNLETVASFAATVDVVTFDHEHVPQPILRELVHRGYHVHPGPDALLYAQDKILMREKLTELGLPVPSWARVSDQKALARFLESHGGRGVLKTARGGYDGKGVRVISDASEAADWFTTLAEDGRGGELLVEELVDFRRELAQLIARRPSGESATWAVVETIQKDGVCAEVLAPAPGSEGEVARVAADIARRIADALGVTGVLAVELFETTDNRILVNELAMRPHNSGHWTIEGSVTSQFEQHLRAVADLPLGSTELRSPHTVMVNVLGGPAEGTMEDLYPEAFTRYPNAKIHSYGKLPRRGRKVGHVTVTGDDMTTVTHTARSAAAVFGDIRETE
ncbi:5-(carboxyamino)imidazole ribonucleotide synthase [Lysinibacter sp. HNR]|uniref:5-(carboxyamino)imidazole ribonucleotide synthase n=1 Tax=Lysinibacter sp. HNR TaxID=3031408 RepID=UPI002434CA7F|nr:5-(carboxyamino)imidazole ribonucleotide synthase [Lysinibacter sp. HNR]WGD38047.1 5-(carboxyamino)imidazole ribonucleotide synthase [Lysinibacter sp. HNR]